MNEEYQDQFTNLLGFEKSLILSITYVIVVGDFG